MNKKARQRIERCRRTQARSLDLQEFGLTEVPDNLGELTWLEELYLSRNEIEEISGLELLKNLKVLYLHRNQISEIQGLEKLIGLDELYLHSNQISKIKGLERLTALTILDLSFNQISTIEGLDNLINLKKLYLNSNQISEIGGLEKLSNLNLLWLDSNQISKIKGLGKLKQLKYLNLQNNKIKDISNLLTYLKASSLEVAWKDKFYANDDDGMNLNANPIQKPPLEIVKQGKQDILNWFAANKKELNEIKVILIGEPKAGKTSILKRLKHNVFNPEEKQTDGIKIKTIAFGESEHFTNQKQLADITAYFWDFGGQEIMSATHQFFLTKRAVYILVLDARIDKDSSGNIRKWIKQIEATGGKSSIIIVANQIDVNAGFGFKNESDLADEFPQIKYFLKTSCLDGEEENIEDLKNALEDLIPKAEMFKTEIDERWFPIKEQLQKDTKEKNYIDESAFVKICNDNDLSDKIEQESLIRFLHDLGIVLNFDKVLDKANDNLKEYFVLDPYWITYGVYQILTSSYAAKQNGIVAMDKLEFIINEEEDKQQTYEANDARKIQYSRYQRTFLLEILREFKLCFVKDNSHFIIPDLLDTKEPKEATAIFKNNSNKLSFIYEYEYLPKSVLPHIMVETDKYLSTYWRSGCLIVGNDCQALVKDYSNKITIEVIGETIKKKDVLAVIRDLVESINKEQGIEAERLIPLPEVKQNINYDEFINRFNDGQIIHKIYNPIIKEYNISELLDGIPMQNRIKDYDVILKLDQVLGAVNEVKGILHNALGEFKFVVENFNADYKAATASILQDLKNLNGQELGSTAENQQLIERILQIVEQNENYNAEQKDNLKQKLNDPDVEVRHKLIFGTPGIIDFVLPISYKAEISLSDKQKLPKTWKDLKALFFVAD